MATAALRFAAREKWEAEWLASHKVSTDPESSVISEMSEIITEPHQTVVRLGCANVPANWPDHLIEMILGESDGICVQLPQVRQRV